MSEPVKHTPGPWIAGCSSRRGYAFVFAGEAGGRGVADCRTVDMELPEAMANARLIAAAPQLLEELEMVATLDRPLTAGEKRRVNAAIAIAKGAEAKGG